MIQMAVGAHDQPGAPTAIVGVQRDLSAQECWLRLSTAAGGRVVLVHHGRALDIAVNHVTDGSTIVFRTGAASPLGLLASREPVTFQADDRDRSCGTGWRVEVTGSIERVEPQARAGIDPAPPPWAPGRVEAWMRIVPISITGSRINEPSAGDDRSEPNPAAD
jgi:uncharacterized protein